MTEYHVQRRERVEKRARQAARRRRTIKRLHDEADRASRNRARMPDLVARPLKLEEARQAVDLKMMSGSTDWELRKRVLIVLASAGGQSVDEIAETYTETTEYVREVIHAFNKQGLAALSRL